jgi:DNA-binding transcriptional ArsR family regulator
VTKRDKSGGQEGGRRGAAKGSKGTKRGSAGKAKPKAKPKRKRPSHRGTTRKARERATGLIDPSLHVVVKDELRIQILSIAIQRPISPREFADEANIALNVASYHFRVLREHGFLEIVEEVKVRGAVRHMHIATKSGFISDADWGEVAQTLRPGVAGAILQDFNNRVTQAIESGHMFTRDDACLYWAPRDLDEIAYLEQVKMIAWCIEESERLEVETVSRRANGDGDGISFHVTFAIAGFPSPTHAEVKAKEREKKRRETQKRKRKSSQDEGATKRQTKGRGVGAKDKDATRGKG